MSFRTQWTGPVRLFYIPQIDRFIGSTVEATRVIASDCQADYFLNTDNRIPEDILLASGLNLPGAVSRSDRGGRCGKFLEISMDVSETKRNFPHFIDGKHHKLLPEIAQQQGSDGFLYLTRRIRNRFYCSEHPFNQDAPKIIT
jgi:hypothetical protein